MKIWVAAGLVCLLCAAAAQKMVRRDPYGNIFVDSNRNYLPILPGSALLAGTPPSFLMVTNEHEHILLQHNEPHTGAGAPIYPSMARDGKTIAYARVKVEEPHRVVDVSVLSATNKRADYVEGEYSGSIAISLDATRLEFSAAQQREGGPGDNRLHIVELKSGHEFLGPEVSPYQPVVASWSPDSRYLAYAVSGEIRVWDSVIGDVRKVADGDLPAWSPSGEWIAYLPASPLGSIRGHWPARCLAVHPDGTGARTLVSVSHGSGPPYFASPPVWSPDSEIVLLSELDDVNASALNVRLLDIRTLKLKTVFGNSSYVFGWAAAN